MEGPSRREREKMAREETIVEAAERVFISKGFDDASMDEIAREAEFTKRTLYQYFSSKEDLYSAVVLRSFRGMAAFIEAAQAVEADGFGQIRRLLGSMYRFFRERPEHFRLISLWSYGKRGSIEGYPSYGKLLEFNDRIFGQIAGMIAEGSRDGSIRGDLDPGRTACGLVFLVVGFLSQLSMTGESFTRHFSLGIDEFCDEAVDLLMAGLALKRRMI
jgi:AcrR family transcriptional regulator